MNKLSENGGCDFTICLVSGGGGGGGNGGGDFLDVLFPIRTKILYFVDDIL